MTKGISKTKGLAKAKTTKKVANELPVFKVLAPEVRCANGKLNWGIGETTNFSILRHINDDFKGLNRETTKAHKRKVHESIMKNGDSLSVKVVIYDGKLYRVDGNNRGEAMNDGSGAPIRFSFRYVETLDELIEIMIDHNDKAKNWGTDQYVSTHATNGSDTYKTIQRVVKAQRLNTTIAAAIVGNTSVKLAKEYIRNGKMVMDNRTLAMGRAQDVKDFFDMFVDGKELKKAPLDYQRMGEGLIAFIGSISWNMFHDIKRPLAIKLREETLKGYLIGKKGSTEFEEALIQCWKKI